LAGTAAAAAEAPGAGCACFCNAKRTYIKGAVSTQGN
jgi:hypothetical protein